MRRMIMTAVATVSLAAPSAALAHHGARHHHHHRGHHARVLAFHAQSPASSTSGPPAPGSPSSTPAAGESAGTIASFTNGVLTITLSDGSTVSGKVTERTEIECPAPSSTTPPPSGPTGFGERQHGDDGHFDNSNDESNSGADGEGRGGCPGHEGDGEQGDEHCTSAALVPGASVKEAFLSVSSEGATWLKVEL